MTAVQQAPWWRSAPNPECAIWCDREHDTNEFARGGAMLCTQVVGESFAFLVEVQSCATLTFDDSELEYEPASVAVQIKGDEFLSPQQCDVLAAAIVEAGQLAKATVR